MNYSNLNKIILPSLIILIGAILITLYSEWQLLSNWSEIVMRERQLPLSQFRSFIGHPGFKLGITFCLSTISCYKLWEFITNFNPKSAVMDAIVPLTMVFLAINWYSVASVRNCWG